MYIIIMLSYSDSFLYWCLAYIREGIFDLRINVAVTSPYPWDRDVTNIYIHSYCYLCHCLLLLINSVDYNRLLLSYWVWGSLKISTSTKFKNLSKPPLLLSLKFSKIPILFTEMNMTFYTVFVQVFDLTQIRFTSLCSFDINIIDSADWHQQ